MNQDEIDEATEWVNAKDNFFRYGYGLDTWSAIKLEWDWVKLRQNKQHLYIDGVYNELAHKEWMKTINVLLTRLFNIKECEGDIEDYKAFLKEISIERKRINDRLHGKFYKMKDDVKYTDPDKWDNGYVKD